MTKIAGTQLEAATYALQLVNMTDGTTAGHKAGCSDLKKLAQRHEVLDVEHHATKYDAWLDYNYDFIAEGLMACHDIEWKACANHIPAGEPEADPEAAFMAAEAAAELQAETDAKPLTRKQCVEALAELGYDGPTSYLMPKLRGIVEAVRAHADHKEPQTDCDLCPNEEDAA